MQQQMRRAFCTLLGSSCAMLFLACMAGCSDSGSPAEVNGKVTMGGVALQGGKVTFVYQDGKTRPVATIIQANGQYSLSNPPPGEVKITVEGLGRPSVVKKDAPPPVKVPAKYSQVSTSGLAYTVGKGKQTKDLELNSQ